jgi:hypothetical protein
VAAALLSGCQVKTSVSITESHDGTGTVGVTVDFDRAAVAALGGLDVAESELSYADLQTAGWQVRAPYATPGGGMAVGAVHPYSTPEQAEALLSELAGTGSPGSRPFRLTLTRSRSFWHVKTQLAGTVNLSCGLACFGDSGLRTALGSSTGVDPASLGLKDNAAAAKVFQFALYATLPGQVSRSNAAATVPAGSGESQPVTSQPVSSQPLTTTQGVSPAGGTGDTSPSLPVAQQPVAHGSVTQRWDPVLGQVTQVDLVTQSWNSRSIRLLVTVGCVAVLIVILAAAWLTRRWWKRRRSRRRRGRGAHSPGRADKDGASQGNEDVEVTPAS